MLCKHRQLPDWLDDTVEAGHEVLALAILCAFVEACRANSAATESDSHRLPRSRPQPAVGLTALCCDDFA
jgi:hypothetical protein